MKFLIIDDDISSCKLLQLLLEEYGVSDLATDADKAMELFLEAHKEKNAYDIIFLDIIMPDVTGHDLLKWIRIWEEDHNLDENAVKIVMVSAMKDTKNIFSSLKSGCNNYMTKPIKKQGIAEVMKKLGY